MIRGFFLSVALSALSAHVLAATAPNIVLLLADDWGFSDVGAFGGEIPTPNLDALAAQGMRFTNFHVAASCAPTRAMLMTGVDNHRNGVGNMPETMPESHAGKPGYLGVLDRNVVTIASLLREGGYHTYIAGKWHLGHELHNLPPARGFERSLIQADSGSDNWEMRPYLMLKPDVYWYEEGRRIYALPADYYSSTFFVDTAIKQIESNRGKDTQPFFSYIAFQANHIPLQAPQSFIDRQKGKYDQGWEVLREERRKKAIELGIIPADTRMVRMSTTTEWGMLSTEEKAYQARRMEVYAAMAEAMDHEIGRFVTYLKKTGAYDNTVFVFLSDNGAEASDPYSLITSRWWLDWQYDRSLERLGGKGAYSIIGPSWASAAASPLGTYKFYAGEGGLRVPLIIAGAGFAQAGQIHRSFTFVTDIAPTLLDVAGLSPPAPPFNGRRIEPISGRSLLPVLRGETEAVYPPEQAVGYELSGNAALFKGDFKLLKNLPPIGDNNWHLYNIAQDPGETHDLQALEADRFRRMKEDYARYAAENGVLSIPGGYEPIAQVQRNAFYNAVLPALKKPMLLLLTLVFVLAGLRWRILRK